MRTLGGSIAAAIVGLSLPATDASAVVWNMTASMDCSQANAGAGTCGMGGSGTGSAAITYDTESNLLAWNITWSGLSAPALLMHFHGPALANQNAGIEVDTGVAGPPVIGAAVLNNFQATDLLNQLWYLNLHTSNFINGEIRGQVLLVTTSTTAPGTTTTTTLPPPLDCPASPTSPCLDSLQAKLDSNEKKAGKEKIKLQWRKISSATLQNDFGDPVGGNTAVTGCVYDESNVLVEQLAVARAGAQCAGKDCWKAAGTTGYSYKDKESSSDGVSKIGFKSGDAGTGKADIKGKNNAAKGQTALPTDLFAALTGNTAPTIQMITSDGFCVGATMNEVKKDLAGHYKAQRK